MTRMAHIEISDYAKRMRDREAKAARKEAILRPLRAAYADFVSFVTNPLVWFVVGVWVLWLVTK